MTELPIVEKSACGCGGHDEDLPTLDARVIPHAIRHASIIGAFDSLGAGQAMALIAPHDPLPLLAQLRDKYGEHIDISYLDRRPEAWTLKFARV